VTRIREGEVLRLLGNTGNSDAPHLHFHVMDGVAPLSSNGVPYEFTRFTGEGVVTNLEEVATGSPAVIDTSTLTGRTRRVLPLDQQVVTFRE
jgi:murein DD-endopeptidase MepM/ murein hydrolase activator NlpD